MNNPLRLLRDNEYMHAVADTTFEYLWDIQRHLGAGRLYIP